VSGRRGPGGGATGRRARHGGRGSLLKEARQPIVALLSQCLARSRKGQKSRRNARKDAFLESHESASLIYWPAQMPARPRCVESLPAGVRLLVARRFVTTASF